MRPPKTLRHRVLVLFAILAVGPLLALGVLDYVYARRAVEDVMAAQTTASANRAKALILERHEFVETDALLFSENAETQRLFTLLATGDTRRLSPALAAADTFTRTVWETAHAFYRAIELRDQRGRVRVRLATDDGELRDRQADAPRGGARGKQVSSDSLGQVFDATGARLEFPILEADTDRQLGTVVVDPIVGTVLPNELGALAFGRSGYLLVIDPFAQRVLYDSRQAASTAPDIALSAEVAARIARSRAEGGIVRYMERDSARLAWAENLERPRWTVLSVAAVPEFTAGLRDARLLNLTLVIVIAATTAVAFTILIGRTTRSLEDLTIAARAVAGGDLAPRLPRPSNDEAGMLSSAFDHMLDRVRTMMREIEVSRQLAVLGEFSAQLSHEIRNPLTSIKLNLQGLARAVRQGSLPEGAGPPLDTCLREVNRLDGVVRGVLELARSRSGTRTACGVHALLDRVTDIHSARLGAHGITVVRELVATRDTVIADEEQLVGLLTNLVVNAIDAQPGGGRLLLRSRSDASSIEVVVADDGRGVPAGMKEAIFRPFVTTKAGGTGLGLAMALTVAREHGGTLEFIAPVGDFPGAAFRITLPLA